MQDLLLRQLGHPAAIEPLMDVLTGPVPHEIAAEPGKALELLQAAHAGEA